MRVQKLLFEVDADADQVGSISVSFSHEVGSDQFIERDYEWRIIEPSDTGAVPVGYKLVPIVPTDAMEDAAFYAFAIDNPGRFKNGTEVRNEIYREMIEAAPATPQPALAQVEKEPIKPVEWNDLYDLAQAAGTDSDVCDHDFSGKPITHYDVMITGAYSPFLLRLINLALQKFGNPPPAQAENSEPYIPEIIRRLADWERENGTLAAPTPPEYEAICQLLASASRYESPRQAFDKLNNTAAVDPANTVAPVDGKGNEK